MTENTLLIVEDSEPQRYLLASMLKKKLGYNVKEATHGAEAVAMLRGDKAEEIVAVLLDLEMPEMDGRTALPKIRSLRPDIPVIVLTGTDSVSDVVEMMKLGAADFLVKPPNLEHLQTALHKALHLRRLEKEIEQLRREQTGKKQFADIIGRDGLKAALKLANRAAISDITTLITGESGTGKEVFARAIHQESSRKDKPFIAVNCGAIPKDLIESTLFGHKKGAFTGAIADAMGKFREAEGGTLFLDEVGELSREAQVKLLRVLQTKEIEPVGNGKSVPINVRTIAATNRNPLAEVKRGNFREDLYYRLNVFPIHLPPLRHRTADIDALTQHFIKRYALLEKKNITGLEKDARDWMGAHSWAGNIRELENTIYRAVLMCNGENLALTDIIHIPDGLEETTSTNPVVASHMLNLTYPDGSFKKADAIRIEAMRAALDAHQGHVVAAAEALGISKSTFYRIQARG